MWVRPASREGIGVLWKRRTVCQIVNETRTKVAIKPRIGRDQVLWSWRKGVPIACNHQVRKPTKSSQA